MSNVSDKSYIAAIILRPDKYNNLNGPNLADGWIFCYSDKGLKNEPQVPYLGHDLKEGLLLGVWIAYK